MAEKKAAEGLEIWVLKRTSDKHERRGLGNKKQFLVLLCNLKLPCKIFSLFEVVMMAMMISTLACEMPLVVIGIRTTAIKEKENREEQSLERETENQQSKAHLARERITCIGFPFS